MLAHAGGWDELLIGLAGGVLLVGLINLISRWAEQRRRKPRDRIGP